jgi:integrase
MAGTGLLAARHVEDNRHNRAHSLVAYNRHKAKFFRQVPKSFCRYISLLGCGGYIPIPEYPIMLLTMLFDNFYKPLRLRGRSANTSRLYGCTIRAFSKWLTYPATTDDLTDLTVSRYLEYRASVRSPYTAEKERTQLLSLWRFAADRRIMDDRPCVPPAPLPDRIPTAWTVEQLQGLMRAACATRGYVGKVPASVWYAAIIGVLWETAERIGAILLCKPDDFAPPHLSVVAEYRKGGKRDRVYRLSPETCKLVSLARGERRLFEWPQNKGYLWKRYKDVVARAGLGQGRKCGFHQLRRSSASHYASLGGDPVQLLDHSSPRTTHRWYLDRRLTDKGPAPCEILPRIAGGE